MLTLVIVCAAVALSGCDKDVKCGSISTPVGSVTPVLEHFGTHRFTGTIHCTNSNAVVPMDYIPWQPVCPVPADMDASEIVGLINEACMDRVKTEEAVLKYLNTDWFGSAWVVGPGSTINAACQADNSTTISMSSHWAFDLRVAAGDKFVELKKDMVDLSFARDGWTPEVVAIIEPVREFLHRVHFDQLKEKIHIVVSPHSVRTLSVVTDHGRNATLDFHPVVGREAAQIIIMSYKQPEPVVVPPQLSGECTDCLMEKDLGKSAACLGVEIRNPCGLVVNKACDQELLLMRLQCGDACAKV